MSTTDYDRDDAPTATLGPDVDISENEDRTALVARIELLAEENRRLRSEYARAKRSTYRQTAFALLLVGAVAVLGGLVFPDGREVLFTLGSIGLFGGILIYFLTPEQFVGADVGERVYAATATNWNAMIDELGLGDERLYIPGSGSTSARLFVPQRDAYQIPDDRSGPVAIRGAKRGLLLEPTGAGLFEEFERTVSESLPADPEPLAMALADGLVEQFELAKRADADIDPDGERVTVAVEASPFGDVDRFDHPVASFLAVGFAEGLDRPVTLDVTSPDDRSEWLVTCRWERA